MNSIISSLVFMTTMIAPDISYHIVTDEFHQHNTYSYSGTIIHNTPAYTVYVINDDACRLKNNSVYYNIIDELILVNNRTTQRSTFSLERDVYNRCLLKVVKSTYRPNNGRHYYENYWYPDYNRIYVSPRKNTRRPHRAHMINGHKRIIVSTRHHPRAKVIKKKHKPKIRKIRVVKKTKTAKHPKKYYKKSGKK